MLGPVSLQQGIGQSEIILFNRSCNSISSSHCIINSYIKSFNSWTNKNTTTSSIPDKQNILVIRFFHPTSLSIWY